MCYSETLGLCEVVWGLEDWEVWKCDKRIESVFIFDDF